MEPSRSTRSNDFPTVKSRAHVDKTAVDLVK